MFAESQKITIVIPLYNGEKYIRGALDSCLNQNYTNIAILIVNDGSTDASLSIVEEYEARDKRIRHVSQSNMGLVQARKTGAQHVDTEYLMFLDADDTLTDDAIFKLVENANVTKADIVFANFYTELESGAVISRSNNDFIDGYESFSVLRSILNKKISPTIWGKLIRTDCFKNINVPNEITIGEDAVALSLLLSRTPKVTAIGDYIYHYIQRSASMVNAKNRAKNAKRLLMVDMIKAISLDNGNSLNLALKNFIFIEIFDVLRDGGNFADIKDYYDFCVTEEKATSYISVAGLQRWLLVWLSSKDKLLFLFYRLIFNKVRQARNHYLNN